MSLAEAYDRAARRTPPRVAARRPGVGIEGYWLDAQRFFFVDRVAASDSLRLVPRIFEAGRGLYDLVPPALLSSLFADHLSPSAFLDPATRMGMADRQTLAIASDGQEFFVDVEKRRLVQRRQAPQRAELFSPDGRSAAFVHGNDLWVRDRDTGDEHPLTRDGAEHLAWGRASETGLAALADRASPVPMGLWSPDSRWLLTHRIDERHLPDLALVENEPPGGGRPRLHQFKYPLPGDRLPQGAFAAIEVAGGRMIQFDCQFDVAIFSPFFLRHVWFSTPESAWALIATPDARSLALWRLDLASGTATRVMEEEVDSGYIDANPLMARTPNIRALATLNAIIWYSEREGYGRLYLHDGSTGACMHPLTPVDLLVRDIVHIDEAMGRLYFLAGDDCDPARRALCVVSLGGDNFARLVEADGDIFVAPDLPFDPYHPFAPQNGRAGGFAPGSLAAILEIGDPARGNRLECLTLTSGVRATLAARLRERGAPKVERFEALAADDETVLRGILVWPHEIDPPLPLVDFVYPGPHVAQVPQADAGVDLAQAEALAELGFAVMMLDTRGVPPARRARRQAGFGAFLEPQLADHAAVVRQLQERDPRLARGGCGIIGYSSGGAAVVHALTRYRDVFTVGVAACGNYWPELYSASWSAKYLGDAPPLGVIEGVDLAEFDGKLLLIAGDIDENVHLAQTLRLVDRFVVAGRDVDLLVVPGQGHAVLSTSGYAQRRAWDHLVSHLHNMTPPRGFALNFSQAELAHWAADWAREIRR